MKVRTMYSRAFQLLIAAAACSSVAGADDYRATALALDPVVYFSLDEATLADPAVNLAVGASSAGATGNGTYDAAGPEPLMPPLIPAPIGTSVRFGDNTLRTPQQITTAGATGYTIAFWMRAPANPTGPINLVGTGATMYGFYAMVYLLTDGRVRAHAQVDSNFAQVDTDIAVTDGAIHHIIARFSQPALATNGLLEVFIDGERHGQLVTTRNNIASNLARLYVGRDLREPGSTLVTIDEVALWNRALDATELDLLTGFLFRDGFE